jgi:type I restriction enzyme, S subunit
MTWPKEKLGALADICRGSSPRPIHDTKYFDGGTIPWVKIADATRSGKFLLATKEHVNEYGASFSRRLPPGTILVAASGTLGYTQILGVEGCAHDGWLILQNLRNLDRDYAYYALKTLEQHFFNSGSGAAIQNINTDILRQAEIPYPPINIQVRVAEILSGYDELIENNLRRIRTLNEMAHKLYREWFIQLRFPGYKGHPSVPSVLGQIPLGWRVEKLSQIADVNRAQINARTAPAEIQYIDIASVSPGVIESITTQKFADAPGRARRIVQHGDILWSCVRPNRRSHALVLKPEPATIASTGFAVLTAKEVPFTFLYYATTTNDFVTFLTNSATGAAYPAVSAKTFENANILVPTPGLLKSFGDVSIPVVEQIQGLQHQISNLRRTRDLLLPRLLSGQLHLEVN